MIAISDSVNLFRLTSKAYKCYCLGTGGNSDLDFETARRKLTRNIMLAKPEQINDHRIKYHYGNLKIFVDTRCNMIYRVKNTYQKPDSWGKNSKKQKKINKKLGIPMEVS